MALICMAIFSTDTNGRLEYTKRTLASLLETVDFNRHRLGVYLNSPSDDCIEFINQFEDMWDELFPKENLIVIANPENIGTAGAINALMAKRNEGENIVKMDDDCIVNQSGWIDKMAEILEIEPHIGVIALKRNDLAESPFYPQGHPYHSVLMMAKHAPGETWKIYEVVNHCMGTCQMVSSVLIDKIGGFMQMDGLYGYDDSTLAVRAYKAGFISAFLHGISIDHIDTGHNSPENSEYTRWKQDYAQKMQPEFERVKRGFMDGSIDIFVPYK